MRIRKVLNKQTSKSDKLNTQSQIWCRHISRQFQFVRVLKYMSPRSGWRFSVYVNHPLLWRGHILICSQECCRNRFETILCCWRQYRSCFSSMICCEMGKETDRNLLIHTSSPVKNVQIHVSTLLKDCIKKKTLLSNVLLWTNNLKTKAILGLELFHIRRRRRNQSKACRPWNLYGFNPNPSKG